MESSPNKKSSYHSSSFDIIFEKSSQNKMLIMDDSGKIMDINAAFSKAFCYPPADILGKNISVLFTKHDQRAGKPEKELAKVLQSGHASDENYLVCGDKSLTWVSGESILIKEQNSATRIAKIIQDIQKQKTFENSLKISDEFNESILSHIADAVMILDTQLRVIKRNKSFDRLFQKFVDPGDSLSLEQMLQWDENFSKLRDHLKNIIDNGGLNDTRGLEITLDSDNKMVFDINCSILRNNDEDNTILVILHDVSFYKKAEQEREDIINFVAHELRNPLANLVLVGELMEDVVHAQDAALASDLLLRHKNNLQRLNKMISGLYEATVMHSGQLALEPVLFNFGDMIHESVQNVQASYPGRKIEVHGDANFSLNADRHRLMQVLTNYLSNALKYSGENSTVFLEIRHDAVATVSVRDEGIGISPEQLPFIFERFFRAVKHVHVEGIGLGLYLSRQIIQAHGGKVWVESEPGKGSVFYFSIPIN